MARRRFFVDQVHSGIAEIAGDDARHLTRVLRVEAGQCYELSDNRGVYLAEIEAARKDLVRFRIVEKLSHRDPGPGVILAAALFKFDHFELLVEKATELGVERIVPFASARTDHGLERAAEKRVDRWRKIALEASQQSRRDFLPVIDDPGSLRDALAIQAGHRALLDELTGGEPLSRIPPASAPIALALGPEGGWTDDERAQFHNAGWPSVTLGPMVLRAETAGIAALAILRAAR